MSPTDKPSLRERYPLKRAKIIKKTIAASIPLLFIIAIIALIGAAVSPLAGIAGLLLLIVVLILELAYQWFYFKNYFYDMTDDGLVIRKGVISSWSITLPPHKVQDVYLDQDLFDRIFGLHDLHLSTATDVSQREAHIDGVGREDAETLRAFILSWASKSAGSAQSGPIALSKEALVTMKPEKAGLYAMLGGNVLILFILSIGLLGLFGLGLFIVILPFTILLSYLDYSVIRYEIRKEGVFIRTGFILPRESIFLYRNIQDVEEKRGILDMIFGLRTLTVKTMTAASVTNANMPYLSDADAQRIRTKILELRSQASSAVPDAESSAVAAAARRYAAASGMPLPQKKKLEAPKQEWKEVEKPFLNNFMKAAHYSNAYLLVWVIAAFILLSMLVLAAPGFVFLLGVGFLIVPVFILVAVITYIGAVISDASYVYSVFGDRVMIKYQFITLSKRELPFTKMQDIEKHVSFSNSFARLADIKLETGAKELISRGKSSTVGSASLFMESVPALVEADADKLKLMLAQRMGITLSGMGANPLVKRFPLEKVKPIKKTCEWAIWLFVLYAIAAPFALSQLLLFVLAVFIGLGVLVAKFVYESEYYRRYTYDMNDDVLVIKKGVFGSRELTIPLDKIQDVFINRDLLDLVFGLYDVYVSTATSRSIMNAHIDGVRAENAEALALLLVGKIAEKR